MILIVVGIIALAAFTVEGAIGFGSTVITASIGAQFLPLGELLPAFVPLNLCLSAWLLLGGRQHVAWRVLLVEIGPFVALGAIGGLALWHVPAQTAFAFGFGIFVVGLALLRLLAPGDRTIPRPIRVALLVLGGVAHGLFGTGGPLIVYVVRRRIPDKSSFRATLAVLWLVLNLGLLGNFIALGKYTASSAPLAGVFALALAPGLVLGERVHRALAPERFERLVWIVLLVAGLALSIRSALALW
ncbi:MAG: TSUP family transporter [Proteobacteria bacterium]|nr:TSUP family transporter [Pseudomonadota bacterium]